MNKEYNQLLEESYKLKMELEELEYISPRFLEIVNFYFNRYGFGTKIKKPERYIKIENEYDSLRKRIDELKESLKLIDSKIVEYDLDGEDLK